MAKCSGCERDEFFDLRGRRSTRVNKDGLCPACVESIAEAKADDDEVIERAERIKAQRQHA